MRMQKIEKWRIEELALVLIELSDLLRKGDNREWANVFSHFHLESQQIHSSKAFNLDELKRLIINIKHCFSSVSSFANIVLWCENSEERTRINQELNLTRSCLLTILNNLERLTTEHAH